MTSATSAPSSSALAGGRIRCGTPRQVKQCWTERKCTLSSIWDKKTLFLPELRQKHVHCTLVLFFIRLPVINVHLKMNVDKYENIVYIEFSHLRANVKHGTTGLQLANRCGGLFQASFHVSCSITYAADC